MSRNSMISREANVMADNASRRWDLADTDELLSHINSLYAHVATWTSLTLTPKILSVLNGAL